MYLIDYVEDSFTVTNGEATAINVAVTVAYKYELLNDGNTFVENITQDINAGTSTYEQVLTVALKKQTKASAQELALVVKARPVVVVQDRQGNYLVCGISDGTSNSGDINSGGAKADFNGYNLTFTAIETSPAPYLDSATVTAFLGIVSGTNVSP